MTRPLPELLTILSHPSAQADLERLQDCIEALSTVDPRCFGGMSATVKAARELLNILRTDLEPVHSRHATEAERRRHGATFVILLKERRA